MHVYCNVHVHLYITMYMFICCFVCMLGDLREVNWIIHDCKRLSITIRPLPTITDSCYSNLVPLLHGYDNAPITLWFYMTVDYFQSLSIHVHMNKLTWPGVQRSFWSGVKHIFAVPFCIPNFPTTPYETLLYLFQINLEQVKVKLAKLKLNLANIKRIWQN